jgi:hypothetical protein
MLWIILFHITSSGVLHCRPRDSVPGLSVCQARFSESEKPVNKRHASPDPFLRYGPGQTIVGATRLTVTARE